MAITLQAQKRETKKRSTLTQLRKDGQLAAVLYGYKTETMPISLDYKETARAVQRHGYTSVFQIDVDGQKVNAVLTDIQRDAIKGHVKHADFLAIDMSEELEVDVPIALTGDSIGVREGGVLTQPNHTLKVKVKPSDIPDVVEVDVSNLAVGDTLSVGDVKDKFDFALLAEDDFTLATVTPPAPQVEELDAEAANKTAQDIEAAG
ncbi:MAG: 50S ribosomal protein L25/general stress protein Ctc [Solibacillus sp.]